VVVLDGRVVYTNPAASRLVGAADEAQALGRSIFDFIDPSFHQQTRDRMVRILQHGQRTETADLVLTRLDGTEVHCEIASAPIQYNGRPAVQSVLRDVTDRKRVETELRRLATTDPLTLALNRRQYLQLSREAFHEARADGEPLALIMIDIDHFKQVNDQYGHPAGDRVLATVVEKCRQHLRRHDLIGRMGGEEFGLTLPRCDPAAGREAAERCRRSVESEVFEADGLCFGVQISLGVTWLQPDDRNVEAVIARADQALYEAKRNGRNRVQAA
jgi:diguanylate cyclase (GGDEF)-like protein/PAS domain S-box-containing protein